MHWRMQSHSAGIVVWFVQPGAAEMTKAQRQRIRRHAAVTICQSGRAKIDDQAMAEREARWRAVRRWRGETEPSRQEIAGALVGRKFGFASALAEPNPRMFFE